MRCDQWRAPEITWGTWSVPESELHALPDDLAGLDVVELGCGVAYFSAWLARRGARPVGVDPTPAQLETARRCQRETGIEFPLLEGFGEAVPLPDAAFDLVLSEYGASIWADPYRVDSRGGADSCVPAGLLVFLRNSTLSILCSPDVGPDRRAARAAAVRHAPDRLARGQRRHRVPSRARRLGTRCCARTGFEILDLIEIQAPRRRGDARVLRLRSRRMGEAVAERGDLGRAQGAAALSAPPAPPLLLASTSPQRRAILTQLGIPFDVVAPRYEEHDPPEADATELVCKHARGQGGVGRGRGRRPSRARRRHDRRVGGRIYAKPATRRDAERMLEELAGRTHAVVSGLCLITPAGRWSRRPRRSSRSAR